MSLRTTFLLVLLVALGGWGWWTLNQRAVPPAASASLTIIETELSPADVRSITVAAKSGKGRPTELTRDGETWTVPGGWPARQIEAGELARAVTGLRSRFTPEPADPPTLTARGLEVPAVVVTVVTSAKTYVLNFGEPGGDKGEPGGENRFSRPTYLHIKGQSDIVRLAPGLVGALDRPPDYYLQRSLFPADRPKKSGDQGLVRETAKAVEISAAARPDADKPGADPADPKKPAEKPVAYTLTREGQDWVLTKPFRDLPDREKVKTVLTAVPDIWVEQFVEAPSKNLAEYGLDNPVRTITVVTPGGRSLTLLVGKVSPTRRTKSVTRPGPPGQFGQPSTVTDLVPVAYRYAKLKDNDRIVFEVNADKLDGVFVSPDALREARVAPFKAEDVTRLELGQPAAPAMVFLKDKDTWRFDPPGPGAVDASKVTELLDRLAGLTATGADVVTQPDLKSLELEKPAATVTITVAARDEAAGEAGEKAETPAKDQTRPRTFVLSVGKNDPATKKVAVRTAGRDPVSLVDAAVVPLLYRPALAYRDRRLLPAGELTRVEVKRPADAFAVEKTGADWRLTLPVTAETDPEQSRSLTDKLRSVEAGEFVADPPAPADLDAVYGLAKPTLAVALTVSTAGKTETKTVQFGKPRPGRAEVFAKLADAPAVFTLPDAVRDAVDRKSLSLRPAELWKLDSGSLASVAVERRDNGYVLQTDAGGGKIVAPFQAVAAPDAVKSLLTDLSTLRVDRYESHGDKNLGAYGLDTPTARLVLKQTPGKADPPAPDKPAPAKPTDPKPAPATDRVLLLGKPTGPNAVTSFAKLADSDAIVVVGGPFLGALRRGPLDLLDRALLSFKPESVTKVVSERPEKAGWTAEPAGDQQWTVNTGSGPAPADRDTVMSLIRSASTLSAMRFAAYGPAADLSRFGLAKPTASLLITRKGDGDKPVTSRIDLGAKADGDSGDFYARVDGGPGVVILPAEVLTDLNRTALDLIDHQVLSFDPASVTRLTRKRGAAETLTLEHGKPWRIVSPAAHDADRSTLDGLTRQLGSLRAARVVEYPLKNPAKYGLDTPDAVWTIAAKGKDGKPSEFTLKLGKPAGKPDQPGALFAAVGDHHAAVVLPAGLSGLLTSSPLAFWDRDLARVEKADQIVLERTGRKLTFSKTADGWKLVDPPVALAESAALDRLLKRLDPLRASVLVADGKPDAGQLTKYGLDKPQARWQIRLAGKPVLALQVGSSKPDVGEAYARLGEANLIFRLDAGLTELALAEYRGRSLWPRIDSAQIAALRYTTPAGGFTLEKNGERWTLAGKPDQTVNPDTIRAALLALSELKADHYAVDKIDKEADLMLYGLKPPQVELEIQTPSGKQRLQLGQSEGATKRRYARIPEAGTNAPVFVLSEDDAAAIVRDAGQFTAK